MRTQSKNKVKKYILIAVTILILTAVASIILRYYVEGESNMPFKISKIMVISSAQGIQQGENQSSWNLELAQTNDIYIEVSKNKNYHQTEIINKIILSDIKVQTKPEKGTINFYKATIYDNSVLNTTKEYLIQDRIEFKGAEKSNLEGLEIANQGGLILFRCINENVGKYETNDTTEIKHDGTLLAKCGIQNDDIKFKISFNIEIILESGIVYKAYVAQDLPIGNVVDQGVTNYQKTDLTDIVFKRE